MEKKRLFSLAIIIIAAFVLGSYAWAAAPAKKQAYPSGVELYPAIYGTFSELYPKAKFAAIDFYNNSYTITGITGWALTTPVSYDMIVRLSKSGGIEITNGNICNQDLATGKWTQVKAFGFYNYKKAVSDVTAKILEIANDSAAYERAKKAAMADIVFVYTIMEDFTDLAFKDFIEQYAKGSIFVVEGPVSDVKEVNTKINGVNYKYLVSLSKNIVADSSFYSYALGKVIYCRLYTNRSDVIRLSKTSLLTVSAALISANKASMGTLSLELVSND